MVGSSLKPFHVIQGEPTVAFRRACSRIALGVLVLLGAPLSAGAQGFGRDAPPPYTPAKAAKDLKAVLFNWTWHLGMLRGIDEHELIATLEYQGTGTMQVNGRACTLTKYRSSTNYQIPGQRIQYTCTQSNGQPYSNIEVVNGPYAWNEDIPGAELVAGQGKATPMANAVQERLIRLWASPQGAPKAALAGTGQPDPAKLADDSRSVVGSTSVSWVGSKPVVTFPIPGVPGAMATATLNDNYMAESVVVKQGSNTTEFTYGDYADWNTPLNKVEVLYAGKMTERDDGKVMRDLTTKQTETGSVYVVMPVPASVSKAVKVAVQPPRPPTLPREEAPPPADAPTPRLADGHPDLSGNWNYRGMNWRYGFRRCGPTQTADCSNTWNQTIDYEFEAPSRYGPSRPVYKPGYWDKIQELDEWTNKDDPVMTCKSLGIPREGPPRRIFETDHDVTFLYGAGVDGGGGYAEYRVIPTDGRKHDPQRARETKNLGYTVGHWEGDTLVLDSISFNDETWLGRGGLIHSDDMHIIERLTRKGNEIVYDTTIEDPTMFLEPWVMPTKIARLNPNPDAGLLPERNNCETYETEDVATQIRH
jgi:hypothetical protein